MAVPAAALEPEDFTSLNVCPGDEENAFNVVSLVGSAALSSVAPVVAAASNGMLTGDQLRSAVPNASSLCEGSSNGQGLFEQRAALPACDCVGSMGLIPPSTRVLVICPIFIHRSLCRSVLML